MYGTWPLTIETSILQFPWLRLQFLILQDWGHNTGARSDPDLANMFCSVPITGKFQAYFAFTFDRVRYTFTQLLVGYLNSSAIAHNLCCQDLNALQLGKCHFWHHIDAEGPYEEVGRANVHSLTHHLHHYTWAIVPHKIQGPASSVKMWFPWSLSFYWGFYICCHNHWCGSAFGDPHLSFLFKKMKSPSLPNLFLFLLDHQTLTLT